jgi:acyl-CoA synthetase (NDP forming)
MKGGETDAVKKASLAHTGAMAGNYELYKASFRQWGMIWVEDPLELLDVSKALSILPPPKGDRIAVMSIQAGPGIIMTDLCIKKGLSLARFEKETLDIIKEPWRNMTIRTNPVDMGFATTPGPFQKTIKAVLRDPNVDAILLGVIDPSDIFRDYFSEDLIGVAMEENKPIVVSYVSANHEGAKRVWEELEGKGIVFYPLPSRAVNALAGMVEYGRMLNRQKGLL